MQCQHRIKYTFLLHFKMIVKLQFHETVYRQYGVLVYNKDAQHAESDRLTVQTTQKHVYLHTFVRIKFFTNLYANTIKI